MPLGPNLLANSECRRDYTGGDNWDTGSIGPGDHIEFNGDLSIAGHAFISVEEGKTYRVIIDRTTDGPVSVRMTNSTTQTLLAGTGTTSLDFLAGATEPSAKLSFFDRNEEVAGVINLVEVREILPA